MHVMRTDLKTGIIEIDLVGFWNLADVEAYHRDVMTEAKQIAAVGKHHMLLIDYSDAAIQPQSVVAALASLTNGIERPARRIAAFSTGKMAKLQAKRIAAERDTIAIFATRDAALEWLMEVARPARTIAPGWTPRTATL